MSVAENGKVCGKTTERCQNISSVSQSLFEDDFVPIMGTTRVRYKTQSDFY